jgi:hypothetical protein
VEVLDLGGGELVGEHVEGFEGVLLPLKSGHARTSESMHTALVVRVRQGKSTYLFLFHTPTLGHERQSKASTYIYKNIK